MLLREKENPKTEEQALLERKRCFSDAPSDRNNNCTVRYDLRLAGENL